MSSQSATETINTQPSVLYLYLKHFRSSTIDYVLEKTGYSNITEYEVLCRNTDLFPVRLSTEGFLVSERPSVNEVKSAVFEFSIHHLNRYVRKHIMKHFVGITETDYELLFPEYNSIFVVVPYKKSEETKTKRCRVVESSDDEDDYVPMVAPKPLSGWVFKLNKTTKNSYILHPTSEFVRVQLGIVYYKDGNTTTTWNAPIKNLERPIYYNQKYGGWIVSLSLRDQLLDAGAQEE
jgi:hypothetical protein